MAEKGQSKAGRDNNPTVVKCPACTFENGPVARICLMCGAILPSEDKGTSWICLRCTLNNPDNLSKCQACETKRYPNLPTEAEVLNNINRPTNKASEASGDEKLPTRPPKPLGLSRQKSTLFQDTQALQGEQLTAKVSRIIGFCKESHIKFEDIEFPAISASIYSDKDISELSLRGHAPDPTQIPLWLHPPDIRTYNRANAGLKWAVFRNPTANDIKQGILGNCWYASALSVLAENRNLLEQIFVTKEYSENGVYAMKLCKDGQWTDVIVDDRFPCLANGTLAFCKARRKQLWVPLLEKALAKLYGSYGALISGTTQEGLATLTGFSCESFDFDTMTRAGDLTPGEGTDLLWAKLLSSVESGFLLGCSCGKKSMAAEEFTKVGLVNNHAYSILDVQLVYGHRLLHLRNTWGEFSWTGDWNEYSDSWNYVPAEVKARLVTQGSSEGLFWISFDDWLKYFGAVYVCFVREGWHETRMQNKFQNSQSPVLSMCRLCILEKTEIDISLHQQSNRGSNGYDLADLMFLVYDDRWNLHAQSKRATRNHTNCTTVLEAGYYNIFCLSFTRWHEAKALEYTIVCHSHKPIFMEIVNLPPDKIADALVHLARKKGIDAVCDDKGQMLTYTLNKGWCGQIVVAVNNHRKSYFHIRTDLNGSMNLICTRGLLTVDVIPPLHSQVLNIATHLESSAGFSLRSKQVYYNSKTPQPDHWINACGYDPQLTLSSLAIHKPIPHFTTR